MQSWQSCNVHKRNVVRRDSPSRDQLLFYCSVWTFAPINSKACFNKGIRNILTCRTFNSLICYFIIYLITRFHYFPGKMSDCKVWWKANIYDFAFTSGQAPLANQDFFQGTWYKTTVSCMEPGQYAELCRCVRQAVHYLKWLLTINPLSECHVQSVYMYSAHELRQDGHLIRVMPQASKWVDRVRGLPHHPLLDYSTMAGCQWDVKGAKD